MKGTGVITLGVVFLIGLAVLAFVLDGSRNPTPGLPSSQPTPNAGEGHDQPVEATIAGAEGKIPDQTAEGSNALPDSGSQSAASVEQPKEHSAPETASSDSGPATDDNSGKGPGTPAIDSPDTPSSSTPSEADAAASKTSPAAAHREELAFLKWPKPTFSLVVTGEQLGYFEPCGCTANQLGGMNRRADLFKKIQDLGWEVRGIDVGTVSRRTGRQAQIKFETTMAALRDLRYLAIGIGPEELRLDPGYLISQHVVDSENSIYFLSSNLTFYGQADLGTPLPWRVVELNGVKVGITCVMSDSQRREVIPDREPGTDADISWSDPDTALKAALAHFDAEGVTYRILLSQSSLEESRAFAKAYPAFQMIVTARGFGEGEKVAEEIGPVRLIQAGEKGKHAGVVGVYPSDSETPFRFELITLSGATFGESPAMIEHMRAYQGRLKDESIVTAESEVGHPSGATFVGASKCGECHTKAFSIWKETAHAHAFESLDPANARTGHERLNGVSRTFDPECLSCHVTGWDPQEYLRFRSGFLNREFARSSDEEQLQDLLGGNQCENCHGPGSQHVELVEAGNVDEARASVKVTLEQAKSQGCMKCHDGDNSPDFKFDEYWEQVKHPGMD